MPRFDGLYLSPSGDTCRWLRFWPDRVLMSATTTPASAAHVAAWLRTSNAAPHHARGRWSKRGAVFRLQEAWELAGRTVEATGEGEEDGDVLRITWTNPGLRKPQRVRYAFIALPPEDLEGPPRSFPSIKNHASLKASGLTPASLRLLRKLRVPALCTLDAAALARRSGLAPEEAERLVRWRDARSR